MEQDMEAIRLNWDVFYIYKNPGATVRRDLNAGMLPQGQFFE